ncbi:glucose-6-phosphate isomerase domain protein, partial [Chlamydia psittaci 08DC60]
RFHPKLCYRTS